MMRHSNSDSSHPAIRSFGRSTVFRRGSALLIVLGMLSFMVISAVGFSIYMRQSRVPSSHLRREATARYLLKSALANAVDRLNGSFNTTYNRVEGVYDDPYPGLNNEGTVRYNGDYWVNRVFTPFGQVDASETVSTLTLEGLGYIPPAIINEVRLRSRTTRTAKWTNLAYDLGRYAFCAVDVSDCFDINKLKNVKRRSSHAGERISLSALYPEDPDTLVGLLKSAASDTEPFVSIGDFNVAVGESDYTPFVKYINNGGNNGSIYLNDDEAVSNALLITDTWFPPTNGYLTAELELKTSSTDKTTFFDLSRDQPFEEGEFGTKTLFELPTEGGLAEVMNKNLGPVGLACLYDYLDEDQIPFSLALPTVEVAPMVCGFSLIGDVAFKFDSSASALPSGYGNLSQVWQLANGTEQHDITRTVVPYVFRGITCENLNVAGTVMFPFKRTATDKRGTGSFKAEALVAVCFANSKLRSRLTNKNFRPTKTDWQNGGVRDNVVFYKTEASALSFGKDVTSTSDAFAKFTCQVKPTDVTMPAFYKVTESDTTAGIGSSVEPLPQELAAHLENNVITVDGTKSHATPFTLFNEYGEIASELTTLREKQNADKLYTGAERAGNPGGTKQNAVTALSESYRPTVLVWVRITDSSGKTVDLSPATFADDNIYIDGCNYGGLESEEPLTRFSGKNVPVLPFKGAEEFKFEEAVLTTFDGTKMFEPQGWKAFAAVDPRYNFAPEDWFGLTEDSLTPERWRSVMGLTGSGGAVFGSGGRDRDIFMFTSDQKNLQSIGELQFLPFVQRLGQNANSGSFDFHGDYDGNANFAARSPSKLGDFANGDRFWKTYSGYDRSGWNSGACDPYYELRVGSKRVTVVNGSGDFRVNPLSDDPRILSAAIFDTPWDYYVASTNRQMNKAISSVEGSPETFAFGTEASISADKWNEKSVAAIAGEMRDAFRNEARNKGAEFDWGELYRDFDWECAGENKTGDDQVYLLDDVDLGSSHPLHGVDRKFLFSYWRECFQNRQHLFLVFLRAEPLTVGGAGGDSLANSQLGARGVALVWRDPAPPKPTSGSMDRKSRGALTSREDWRTQYETQPPHRTRVLFYHQFD